MIFSLSYIQSCLSEVIKFVEFSIDEVLYGPGRSRCKRRFDQIQRNALIEPFKSSLFGVNVNAKFLVRLLALQLALLDQQSLSLHSLPEYIERICDDLANRAESSDHEVYIPFLVFLWIQFQHLLFGSSIKREGNALIDNHT